jgi:hypothetical protein
MQKKVGIKLRQLESSSNHQNNIITNINYDQGRKELRAPSPINRRKIFANNERNGYSRNLYGLS